MWRGTWGINNSIKERLQATKPWRYLFSQLDLVLVATLLLWVWMSRVYSSVNQENCTSQICSYCLLAGRREAQVVFKPQRQGHGHWGLPTHTTLQEQMDAEEACQSDLRPGSSLRLSFLIFSTQPRPRQGAITSGKICSHWHVAMHRWLLSVRKNPIMVTRNWIWMMCY